MQRSGSPTGRVVPHSARPREPATVDTWWGGEPWSRFMARVHGADLRYLVIADQNGTLCATAPLLLATPDRGPLFLRLPAVIGDEHVFGDCERLAARERAEYEELLQRLAPARGHDHYPAVAVSTRGTDHGLAIALGSPVARAEILRALPELLAVAAAELGCPSSGILHLTGDDSEIVQRAGAVHGYQHVVLGADTALDLPAVSGRDEYFASLRSRRRTRLRRELGDYQKQGLRTTVHTGRGAVTENMVLLQARLRAKHGDPAGVSTVRREFADINETVGDSCVVFTAERDGQPLGFALCLYDEPRHELFVRSAGFDHDEVGAGCYLALTYGEIPLWAADNGVRRIRFGMSTYEAKRSRGCTLMPMHGHVRFTGPGGQLLHQAAHWQSLGERRRLTALGADLAG